MEKGKVLREYIKQSDFTQRDIAHKLNIRENYFSTLLSKKKLSSDLIDRVCTVLGVTPEEIFSKKENPFKVKYDQLKETHDALQKSCFDEKIQLVKQVQDLMAENHELKNDIHALKDEILELKEGNLKLRGK